MTPLNYKIVNLLLFNLFFQYCPKTHLLVLKTTSQAADATSSIVRNFQKEIDLIPNCANNKFNNAAYLKLKEELRTAIIQCLR